ncbi:MAG: hypothetical protein U1F65_11445 [Verrucomicrobiota bacterium]
MSHTLNMVGAPVEMALMRKGSRVFALLGKATALGLEPFGREDVGRSWAVTSEYGCLRLERMSGDEEVTGLELFLPRPLSYDYGICGTGDAPELTRAVFGLLPAELDLLVSTLRQGSFPMLGYALTNTKCSVSAAIIPGSWPHVVISNLALYGNVVSVETFVRILVSSLPQGHLATRFPALQPLTKQLMKLSIARPRGIPYNAEILGLAPAEAPAPKTKIF